MRETNNEPEIEYEIKPLGKHDRAAFSCGTEALDIYIRTQASQDVRRGAASVYVATLPSSNVVCGYYTLSTHHVKLPRFPEDVKEDLPRYQDLPAILLGRLAVDNKHQGKRLGEKLLMDSLMLSLFFSSLVGAVVLIVHAKDEIAKSFYTKYLFRTFADKPLELYMPLAEVKRAFADSLPEIKKEGIERIRLAK